MGGNMPRCRGLNHALLACSYAGQSDRLKMIVCWHVARSGALKWGWLLLTYMTDPCAVTGVMMTCAVVATTARAAAINANSYQCQCGDVHRNGCDFSIIM